MRLSRIAISNLLNSRIVWLSYTSKFPAAARILFGFNTGVAMRKFIVLVLASLCVLSVGACAPKAPPPTPVITK